MNVSTLLPENNKTIDYFVGQNPEEDSSHEELRCRICYDTNRPLISVCGCSGSIAFVHEDCILDWITKKIEAAAVVQIPYCEICHEQYLARMKVGKKKICKKMLMEKIYNLSLYEKLSTILNIVWLLFAIVILVLFLRSIFQGEFFQLSFIGCLLEFFTKVVSQVYVLKIVRQNYESKKRLAYDSMVQIVEVTLQPRIALRK